MYVVMVDILASILFAAGVVLLFKSSETTGRAAAGADPGTYARRIVGTMIAAFGLAIGLMVTLFHFASQG
jgi:hypothetical protein